MTVVALSILAVATAFASWRAWRRIQFFLHILQLESYHLNEFLRWVLRRITPLVAGPSHLTGAVVLAWLSLAAALTPAAWPVIPAAFTWSIAFASSYRYTGARKKKPLRYTPRLLRLLSVSAAPALAAPLVGLFLGAPSGPSVMALYTLAGWLIADLFAPIWVILASLVLIPVEWHFREGFKRKAMRRLRASRDLTLIGITGSYGKTSVKFIVAEVLRQRYQVLATPGSYNTPMGICLVVNNQLRSDHRMLVLEMGARYEGDIRELCLLAPPDIGIVTSVGMAHLETMGPIERVERVKGELVRHMKPSGPVILNGDDPRVIAMAKDARGTVWRVSTEGRPAEISAREILYGPDGSTFIVRDETGAEWPFRTQLLGRHNVLNLLFGVAVGRIFSLTLRQIAHAVLRIEPVEHRLQLRGQGLLTVIDDAFNSNPEGARSALDVLSEFRGGRRIVITPGMIELGEAQAEENRRFGAYMAGRADLVLLVGPSQTRPIREGLAESGFPDAAVLTFSTLYEAQDHLARIARAGDTVLYENDLPDQYTEPG